MLTRPTTIFTHLITLITVYEIDKRGRDTCAERGFYLGAPSSLDTALLSMNWRSTPELRSKICAHGGKKYTGSWMIQCKRIRRVLGNSPILYFTHKSRGSRKITRIQPWMHLIGTDVAAVIIAQKQIYPQKWRQHWARRCGLQQSDRTTGQKSKVITFDLLVIFFFMNGTALNTCSNSVTSKKNKKQNKNSDTI